MCLHPAMPPTPQKLPQVCIHLPSVRATLPKEARVPATHSAYICHCPPMDVQKAELGPQKNLRGSCGASFVNKYHKEGSVNLWPCPPQIHQGI